MLKRSILFFTTLSLIFGVWFTCTNCRTIRHSSDSRPITHELWDQLLKKHVRSDGFVNYKGFIKDSAQLSAYTRLLSSAHPNEKNWSRSEQMAYWINAYNAFTVQLITRHYPVESIKDIKRGLPFVNTVWDIKFIKIQGFTYDLNNIEHNILRPIFKDARVHCAVNCASFSCPPLRAEAYTAARLDEQLTDGVRRFLNDPLRNKITADKAAVSEIFKWFKGDFEDSEGSVRKFLNKYAPVKINDNTDIEYLDYNWSLNDQK